MAVVGLLAAYKFFSKPLEEQCLDLHRKDLNDPKTAYAVGSYQDTDLKDHKTPLLRVEIRAKNGFGAFVPGYVECVLDDGELDETRTSLRRTEAFLEDLKRNR